MALSHKRQAFVDAYLKTWNAAQAALNAGYSPRTAYSQGPRLLTNVEVQARIAERLKERHMDADECLQRLADQSRADVSEFTRLGGAIDWDAVKAKGFLVKKIKHNAGQNSEIELHDSQRALELIGKHHKLFADRLEIGGKLDVIGFEMLLERVYGSKEETIGSEQELDKHGDVGG